MIYPGNQENEVYQTMNHVLLKVSTGDTPTIHEVLKVEAGQHITAISKDHSGNWLIGAENTFYLIDSSGVILFRKDLTIKRSIYQMLEVPGHGYLMSEYSDSSLLFMDYSGNFSNLGRKIGIKTWINKLFLGNDGAVWIGTMGSGIFRVVFNEIELARPTSGTNLGKIFGIQADHQKNIWINCGYGLMRMDQEHGKLVLNKASREWVIVDMHQRQNRDIWYASLTGIHRVIEGDTDQIERVSDEAGVFRMKFWEDTMMVCLRRDRLLFYSGEHLEDERIVMYDTIFPGKERDIIRAGPDTAWIGTMAGLYAIDIHGGQWNHVKGYPENLPAKGFFQNDRGRIYVIDTKNIYWKEEGEWDSLAVPLGKLGNIAESLVEDDRGRIWMGTRRGLFVLDNGTFHQIGTDDGLFQSAVYSLYAGDDGVIYVGGNEGLSLIQADLYPRPISNHEVSVKEVQLDGVPIQVCGSQVFPDGSKLMVKFETLEFDFPERLNFRYRLSETDSWIETNQPQLQFVKLQHSEYLLEMQVANAKWGWSESAELQFEILPPWYLTIWAYLVYVALGGFLIFSIVSLVIRSNRKREQAKAMLTVKVAESELRALQAQINPHFLFNVLNTIQGFIFSQKPDFANTYLSKFSHLIRMFLESSRKRLHPLASEVSLLRHYLEMEAMSYGDRFSWDLEVKGEEELAELILIPTMLYQPYVENAIQHGLLNREEPGGFVHILFVVSENKLECMIQDNGVGRKRASEIKRDQKRMYESFGMELTKERIEVLHALTGMEIRLEVEDLYEDQKASGTLVKISLHESFI
ncbi:histidine kinase [Pontibacter sp. G13]|uniref:sensor histidine kinase n=1 Tax=Pontibacter sp. G13 TaxID=3074898 RepID=UPI00288996DF|nr:histidine kinase [Pontibacter sp. G13]WNJ21135.1 histidine kinase [Pontibacter sp. G13]